MERRIITHIFPTESGYQFVPQVSKNRAELLALLEKASGVRTDKRISRFLYAGWLGNFWTHPMRPAVLIAGIKVSHFPSEIHRGRQSMWAVAEIVEKSVSFQPDEAKRALESVLQGLEVALKGESEFSQSLRLAASEGVDSHELEVAIRDVLPELEGARIVSPLISPMSKFFGSTGER